MTTITIATDITMTITDARAAVYFAALEAERNARTAEQNDCFDIYDLFEIWEEVYDLWDRFYE